MKERLITIVTCVILALSLVACASPKQKLMTFQEIYESDANIRKAFDEDVKELKNNSTANYRDVTVEFVDNSAIYKFYLNETMPAAYTSVFEGIVGNSFNVMAMSQINTMRNSYEFITEDPISLTISFINPDGSVFYSLSYSEEQN